MNMDQTVSNCLGLLAMGLLLPYLDRLRMLRWTEHQARVVAFHLVWALWLGWAAFEGLVQGTLEAYHLLGMVGAGLWMSVSRPTWRRGPPEYTSRPMPLHDHDAAASVPSEVPR